jgi:hypothetical protein
MNNDNEDDKLNLRQGSELQNLFHKNIVFLELADPAKKATTIKKMKKYNT